MLTFACHRCRRFGTFHGSVGAWVALTVTIFFANPLTGWGEEGANQAKPVPTIAEKTKGFDKLEGLLTVYLDRKKGTVWLEAPKPNQETGEVGTYLYVEGLVRGLGSNPVGLDRNQIGPTRLVVLRRVGGRLLVEEPNLRFRALTEDRAEQIAVRQSFATSILWAGKIAAEEADGRALVDFTSFVVRDAHNVAARLKRSGQGTFKLDKSRSVLDARHTQVFPENLEFEALLTYQSAAPGSHVRETAPTGGSVTLVQHHSLLRLPDDGYKPRRFDPRAPSFGIRFLNYAAPLSESIETSWIARHRLEKTDPTAARSTVKKPIVYYVDRGVPEPVRSALIEGGSWWSKAFEAAGFLDAFRVELLPEGADRLDARYNVINWVHRATRGWSYGGSVMDPRTGEIVKGHVLLGSLRVRQDRLLFEGLLGTAKTGSGEPDDPIELALARIRQLAAHEVGHTLGFAHNFAASTYGGRASVMDYPAPLIKITKEGELDCSDAYAVGVGAWDVFAVRYAYTQFPPGTDEKAALAAMIDERLLGGLRFLSDADARPLGAAHPFANLWDNGDDPVAALEHTLRVRRIALDRFGRRNVREGTSLARLEEVLAPVYLHHRYQLEAAVKVIGGVDYTYAVRGDSQAANTPIDPKRQRHALDVVLRCLSPEVLDLSDAILSILPPRPFGSDRNREMFTGATGATFDPLGAAATAAGLVLDGLLHPQRCARLVDFHRRDADWPSLKEVLDALIEATFPDQPVKTPRHAALQRVVQQVVVAHLIGLSADKRTPALVRARVDWTLANLARRLDEMFRRDKTLQAHASHLAADISRYLNRPLESAAPPKSPSPPPPGSPIGVDVPDWGRCSFDPLQTSRLDSRHR